MSKPMRLHGTLDVGMLFREFRGKIAITWFLVLLENLLWALVPLFIGRAIDALLASEPGALIELAAVMLALVVVAVGARLYDTRAYGTMRVHFGAELVNRIREQPVSRVNARLDMSREMVDFLEEHVPELLTSVVQVLVSIVILWSFDVRLGVSGVCALLALSGVYALFHRRFYRLNAGLNAQTERQVSILEQRRHEPLFVHLMKLRRREVRLSDTEALLYGVIFVGMFAFILANLWFATSIEAITAGMIFVILSYTWELVDSGVALPAVLQQWTRLSEIRERINAPSDARAD
ncbi:MAG: ABC transporter six-transmembrane domain-containing protein [Pseudomonadota bacterium]